MENNEKIVAARCAKVRSCICCGTGIGDILTKIFYLVSVYES